MCILGLPDKRMGEEVCAAIRKKDGMTLTDQEVKDFCKGNVSFSIMISRGTEACICGVSLSQAICGVVIGLGLCMPSGGAFLFKKTPIQ